MDYVVIFLINNWGKLFSERQILKSVGGVSPEELYSIMDELIATGHVVKSVRGKTLFPVWGIDPYDEEHCMAIWRMYCK